MIEALFVVVLILIACLFYIAASVGDDYKHLENKLEQLERDITYKILQPQIEELAKLKGFTRYHLNYEHVYFYSIGESNHSNFVKLLEVERTLADMKKAIEISCPKKCGKKSK